MLNTQTKGWPLYLLRLAMHWQRRLGGRLDRYFGVSAQQSSVSSEIKAGITTFLAMAYILFVNPQILQTSFNGVGPQLPAQLLTATALAAGFGSILMGILARYPFALAPGLGLNAYLSYTVITAMGVVWDKALALVFVSGLVMVLITALGLRSFFVSVLPRNIEWAIASGIGCFIAFVGAKNCGLIIADANTIVAMGSFSQPSIWIAGMGILLTVAMLRVRLQGAMMLGILTCACIAIAFKLAVFNGQVFSGFDGALLRSPVWPLDLWGALNFEGLLSWQNLGIVFTLVLIDIFDTAGTLIALCQHSKWGRLKRMNHAFMADSVATSLSGLLGVGSSTSYVESAAGIADGGRTGIVAVVVGTLFLLSIFLWPLAAAIPSAATSPTLMIVGCLMMTSLRKIDWSDLLTSFPAFLAFLAMPLTFSIANGIALGLIAHVLLHLMVGKIRSVHPFLWVLTVILLLSKLASS